MRTDSLGADWLWPRRQKAADITAKLRGGDEAGVRQLLEADPKLVHMRDPFSGLPPLHTAVKVVSAAVAASNSCAHSTPGLMLGLMLKS